MVRACIQLIPVVNPSRFIATDTDGVQLEAEAVAAGELTEERLRGLTEYGKLGRGLSVIISGCWQPLTTDRYRSRLWKNAVIASITENRADYLRNHQA